MPFRDHDPPHRLDIVFRYIFLPVYVLCVVLLFALKDSAYYNNNDKMIQARSIG